MSLERLKELRHQRISIIELTRRITEAAAAEKRDLTGEEIAQFDKLYGEAESRGNQIRVLERQMDLDRDTASIVANAERQAENRGRFNGRLTPAEMRAALPHNQPEYRAAFSSWLALSRSELLPEENRALSSGVGSQGGFLLAPEEFIAQLIKFVDDQVSIRRLATKFQVAGAVSLGFPTMDSDLSDADWTTELGTGSEDTTTPFGKRKFQPTAFAKRIKVSKELLRNNVLPVESIVRDRLGYKFAITEEKAFLTGSGSNQPLGLFTASADGVPTSRDFSTGNTATSIGFDGLKFAMYQLKEPYRRVAQWLFHRDAIRQISQLKDTQNRYLWEPSNQVGQPDMLLGLPVISSEYVPNTFTTGLYVGMVADFSQYWIADGLDLEIQRLEELYAETNQIGFIGRQSCDGMPVLAEAFARIRLT